MGQVVRHVEAKRSSEDTLAILVSNTTKMGISDTKYGIKYCIVVIMLHRRKKTFAGEYCTNCHVLVGAADFTRRGSVWGGITSRALSVTFNQLGGRKSKFTRAWCYCESRPVASRPHKMCSVWNWSLWQKKKKTTTTQRHPSHSPGSASKQDSMRYYIQWTLIPAYLCYQCMFPILYLQMNY